eukprot:6049643-Pyramimonas_sp.AAC.1
MSVHHSKSAARRGPRFRVSPEDDLGAFGALSPSQVGPGVRVSVQGSEKLPGGWSRSAAMLTHSCSCYSSASLPASAYDIQK